MAICSFDLDHFNYSIESNLDAMGLPSPQTLFGSVTTVSGAMVAISNALNAAGSDIPLSAIARSGVLAKYAAGITASYYTGAVIGSALMATGRSTTCSMSELKKAFRDLGIPSWAADNAIKQDTSILRKH